MKPYYSIGLLICAMLMITTCHSNVDTNPEPEQAEATLQALLEEAINTSYGGVPGVSMSVIAPSVNLRWTGAAGFDSQKKDQTLSPEQTFRIASITKTFVATAILRLHEQGSLSIEDPLRDHISQKHLSILERGGLQKQDVPLLDNYHVYYGNTSHSQLYHPSQTIRYPTQVPKSR